MPPSAWASSNAASSLRSFYKNQIKDQYDCRDLVVLEY